MLKSLIPQTLPDWLRFFKDETTPNPKPPSSDWSFSSPGDLEIVSLEEFLKQFDDIPHGTALLGVCEDGLPVLVDLNDQNTSPVAILGDGGCGKTSLMQGFLESALHWSPSSTIQFLIIAEKHEPFERYCEEYASNCLGLLNPEDPQVEEALLVLTERIEETGFSSQAITLVFVDDLAVVRTTSCYVRNRLEQIMHQGMKARIWLLATLSTANALEMGRWLRYFRTRVLGIMPPQAAIRLGLHPGLNVQSLPPSRQFAVFSQQQWLKFWTLTLK